MSARSPSTSASRSTTWRRRSGSSAKRSSAESAPGCRSDERSRSTRLELRERTLLPNSKASVPPPALASRRMSLALVCAALLVSTGGDESDWPQWRGALGDGLSHGTAWSAEGRSLWSADVGLGYSAPAVSQGRVVALGFDVGRGLDVLRCLDLETGAELWHAEYQGELRDNQHEGGTLTSPAIAGNSVFFANTSGVLRSLRLADGALEWEADLAKRHGVDAGYYGFASSPVLAD